MTRKNFEALAGALKEQQPGRYWSADKHAQYTIDVHAIAQVLAANNPHFDFGRFYTAAGLVQAGPGDYAESIHEHSSACDCKQKAA
ncbi:MAG: hypothetical protein KGI27_14015 [Thaumarchaeota archaeon]|nr:hypothetical protein [Nitrososphaerota archaeon]